MGLFFGDNSAQPVTSILDSGGNQIFETVGLFGLSADSAIAYPQHTLENGVNISDHSIRLQDRVSVRCMLDPVDYVEVYRRIKKAFNENASFIVQTKVETYTNLYIENLPHEEDAKNTVALTLDFLEQRFQSPTVGSLPPEEVSNPADSDTVSSGNKQPTQPSGTALQKIAGYFGGGG